MQYSYDAVGNTISYTDALGHTSTNLYDAMRRLTSSTDALNHTTSYTYDPAGQLQSVKSPLGYVTNYQYNSVGATTQVTYPDNTFDRSVYNGGGQLVQNIDQAGHTTGYTYDAIGRTNTITLAVGTSDQATTTYGYDQIGRLTTVNDALGHQTTTTYDLTGQVLSTSDALAHQTVYGYDGGGQQTSMTDANNHMTTFTYDSLGRPTKTNYNDGTNTQTVYDPLGRAIQRIDQAGKTSGYNYDTLGQLLSVTDALNHTTSYGYDANGNLTNITDANNHTTSFGYDALNRQIKKTLPDGLFETVDYDANGNTSARHLLDGLTISMTYDTLNRVSGINFANQQSISYSYTSNGQRKSITDPRGTTNYSYDNQDRVTQVVQPDNSAVGYTYDAIGNRLSMTTPSNTTNYGYDANNRLTSANSGSIGVTYTYDNIGLLQHRTLSSGIVTDYTYDTLNRMTDLVQHKSVPVAPLAAYHYTLGTAGNRLSVTDQDHNVTSWTYDDVYRLLSETRASGVTSTITPTAGSTGAATFVPATNTPGAAASPTVSSTPSGTPAVTNGNPSWQVSYTYDAVGNRLTNTENGHTTSYTYDARDRLTQAGTASYQYDPRGNTTQVTDVANVTQYTWDARNHLVAANVPGGQTASYVYDGDGRRVKQTIGGQSTNFLWDAQSHYGDVAQETDNNGGTASYVMAGNDRVAQTRSGATSFYLRDGQGSTRALADNTGTPTDRYVYDAFGTLRGYSGTTTNAYQYAGQQFDSLTGLYDMRARYYNPSLGRFMSADTMGLSASSALQLNRYVYTGNSPIDRSDPSGNSFVEDFFLRTIGGAAVGAGLGAISGYISAETLGILTVVGACGVKYDSIDFDRWQAFIDKSIQEGAVQGAEFGALLGGIGAVGGLGIPLVAKVVEVLAGLYGLKQLSNQVNNPKTDPAERTCEVVAAAAGFIGTMAAHKIGTGLFNELGGGGSKNPEHGGPSSGGPNEGGGGGTGGGTGGGGGSGGGIGGGGSGGGNGGGNDGGIGDERQRTRLGGHMPTVRRYRHPNEVPCACVKKSVLADALEALFVETVLTHITPRLDAFQRLLAHAHTSDQQDDPGCPPLEDPYAVRVRHIKRCQEQLRRLERSYQQLAIADEDYDKQRGVLLAQLAQWQAQRVEPSSVAVSLTEFIMALQNPRQWWSGLDDEGRRSLAHSLFRYLLYDLDQQRFTEWRLTEWAEQLFSLT